MASALILTVGTTADPLLRAVEEQRAQDSDLRVYLLYGRPFPGQDPSPFDVANQVREWARNLGVDAEPREAPEPEDIDSCLRVARALLQEVAGADRVVVDFTGGTKALSAALVHAALTEPIAGQLVLEYTGGAVRDAAGRVLKEAMHVRRTELTATDEVLRQVLELVRRSAYREARLLAARLPEAGRPGFVRRAVEALYAWDEFDYQASCEVLRRLHEAARALRDVPELAPLAALCTRLLESCNVLLRTVQHLTALQDGRPSEWPSDEGMVLLSADALENGSRRLSEDRPTDAVLRAYRAVEVAVQARLLRHRLNPWRPDWTVLDPTVVREYRTRLAAGPSASTPSCPAPDPEEVRLPRDLALTTGLRLVEVLDGPLPHHLAERLQDVQRNRNHSYLEHGYARLRGPDADRLLEYAEDVCAHLLGADGLSAARRRVTHRVWT